MAYAALVSLAQTIDLILNHDKFSISSVAKENIVSAHEYVIFLISFLEDFPEKANHLEGKIRDAATETEDIIEYFMWKQIRMSWWNVGFSRAEFENQLKKATEGIGLIAGQIMDDKLCVLPAAASSSTPAPMGKNDVAIGLDDDVMAIKDWLCGTSSKLQVIPILGMGGIGKTTLARNVYHDPIIIGHFVIRAWVTISQHYSALEILLGILDSVKLFEKQMLGQKNEFTMAEKVYKSLKGRRYLIVLDDVWSTNAWDGLRNIFPDDNNGSRIMLTTRLSDVAAYPESCTPLHHMKFMDGNQSWNLFKQKVFKHGQDCPPELEIVGKQIARSCGGLPLAIVLVAGVLSSIIRTPASWDDIAKKVISSVDGQLENILSFSYRHLPHHLRPCFLFLGSFPEDCKIPVSRLIKLWVAEGFLKHHNGYKSLEEHAEEYLEDLVKRSLVLVTSRKTSGKIKSCSLHDMVRDLCTRKAQEEKFLLHVTDSCFLPESIKNERRISVSCLQLHNIWGPTIHTIVCFLHQDISTILAFAANFRLLRVLDLINDSHVLLHSQVFELFHLRYLGLGHHTQIPPAISNLGNLQTLIIRPLIRPQGKKLFFSSLPSEIWRMPQLRHLLFFYFYRLPDPTDGSTLPLENLQTLSPVGSLVCSEKILKMIPNLKKLGIVYSDCEEYHLHNLIYLYQLEKLKVTMYNCSSWRGQNPAFPRTLKKLTLVGGGLPWKDMAAVGSLPKLEVLKLRDFACYGDIWETTDGEFPELKCLMIERSCLQHWIAGSSHFPRLKCLVLYQCLRLKRIPNSIGEIPTLELIEVDGQNKSLVNSSKQIQEVQRNYGNDALQVHCIY